MYQILVRLIDAAVTLQVNTEDEAESVRRRIKGQGMTYKGIYYGPGGIIKIEIREPSNGG